MLAAWCLMRDACLMDSWAMADASRLMAHESWSRGADRPRGAQACQAMTQGKTAPPRLQGFAVLRNDSSFWMDGGWNRHISQWCCVWQSVGYFLIFRTLDKSTWRVLWNFGITTARRLFFETIPIVRYVCTVVPALLAGTEDVPIRPSLQIYNIMQTVGESEKYRWLSFSRKFV